MAKNLKPCNFIVTVGGKKVSMPYDAMRKYLLENPEVWMPSSTRKIGAGKAQASLGGRKHGSPYDFDKFTTEKIGTGEGAQAFGWGLYFTDLESIARGYAKALSTVTFNNKKLEDNPIFDKLLTNLDAENEGFYNSETGNITNLKKFKDYIDGEYEYLSEEVKKIDENHRAVKRFLQDNEYSEQKIKETKESLSRVKNYNIESTIKELIQKGVDESTAKTLANEFGKMRKESVRYLYDAMKYMAGRESEVKRIVNFVKNDFKSDLNYFKYLKDNFENFKLIRNIYDVTLFKGKKRFELAPLQSNDGKWNVYDYKTYDEIQGMSFDERQGVLDDLDKAKPEKRFNSKEEALEWIADNNEYTWLEWDRPISIANLKKIKNQAEKEGINNFPNIEGRLKETLNGVNGLYSDAGAFYNELKKAIASAEQTSKFLLRAGIDGVKYPAESIAKGATSETARGFNYVVFDENAVTIDNRIQFSLGNRGENISEAIIEAGAVYKKTQSVSDAIKAGVAILMQPKFGYTKKEAEELIKPIVERRAEASPKPAGWIKMGYIPKEVRESININTTTMEDLRDLGIMAIDNGEIDPKELCRAFAEGYSRPLSAVDVSALVAYKVDLTRRYNKVLAELIKAKDQKFADVIREKEAQMKEVETELQNFYITSRKTAYDQGLAFRTRQMLLDEDFNLLTMRDRYKATYGPIPRDVNAEMVELDRRFKELEEKEAQLELEKEQFEREKAMANIAAQVEQKKTGRDVGATSDRSFIQKAIINNISKLTAIFGGKKPTGQASLGRRAGEETDPEYISAEAASRAANALSGIKKVEEKDIAKAIDAGVNYIKSTKWYKQLDAADQKEIISAFTKYIKANTKPPVVKVKDDRILIPHKTIREYTERILEEERLDNNDRDKYKKLMNLVAEAIYNDFVSTLPLEATVDDVRNAITNYGTQTYPSQEDLEKDIRLMKQVGLKMAQYEAILSGQKPLKTGYQRDPQSPEARELLRQINEGLKALDQGAVDSEAYIKSALDKIKTTLRNQIEDLDRQIKAGQKKTIFKREIEYDDEATSLRELRDSLKKHLDEIDTTDKTLRAERKLERLIANVENSIAEYKRRIAEQDFSSFKKMQEVLDNLPQTGKYKSLIQERDQLRKQYAQLKKGPEKSPLEKRLEQLEKEYDSLIDGTYTPKTPPVQYNDPRITDLRDKIKDLKKQLGITKSAEEIKLERLRKDLADLYAGKIKTRIPPAPDSPEVTALRQQISDQKELLGVTRQQEIRRAEKAKETALKNVEERIRTLQATGQDVVGKAKIETAYTKHLEKEIKKRNEIVQQLLEQYGIAAKKSLEAEKKRVQRYIDEKLERINTGNFNPKPRKQVIADQELIDLRREKEKIKERYEELLYKAELAKMTWPRKIVEKALDVWDAPKTAVSALDMSAPLRQGFFEVLTQNPVTVAKAFKFMFQNTFDIFSDEKTAEEKYEKWLYAIKESPEYYEMKAAGLYLALPNAKLKAKEENFVNKLVWQIPVLQRPIFGMSLNLYKKSERAYNSFLNYLRVAGFMEVAEAWKNLPEPITLENNKEEYQALAELINISTGRPSLGGMEAAATAINRIIFSVRLMWSRFLLVSLPFKIPFLPPAARKLYMMRWLRGMGSLAGIYFLIYLWLNNDDDDETKVEFDPRGGFLNAYLNKNTKFNLSAGMSQWVSLISKLTTVSYKKTSTGEVRPLGQTAYDPTWLETAAGFIAGKAAPTPRVFLEYAMSRPNPEEGGRITAFGERYSVLESLGNLAVPLIINDIGKTIEDNNAFTIGSLGLLAFFGGQVNVSTDKYKLPSEIMFDALHPGEKEFNQGSEKLKVAVKQDETERMKSLFKKQVEKRAEEYRKQGVNVDTTDEYGPKMDRVEAEYALETFNRLASDKLLEKTGLKTDNMRQAFFLIMSGKGFAPISEDMDDEQKEATIKAREKLVEKFNAIPEATKINVVKQYIEQAKERERIASEMNKLGVKTYNGKVDFNKIRLEGVTSDWYHDYLFFKDSPNFKKIAAEK